MSKPFNQPVDLAKLYAQALASVMDPDMGYIERQIRRSYSERFHTPLHTVMDLPLDFVYQNVLEASLATYTPEQLVLAAHRTIDPDFDAKEDDAIKELMAIMADELARKGKPKAAPESLKQVPAQVPEMVSKTYGDDKVLGTGIDSDDGLDSL